MFNLTDAMLLVSALALVLGVIPAIRTFIGGRNRNAAPLRNYFGPEYDRDLAQQSVFSETEEWQADSRARFAPLRLRNPEPRERR
jgi:hypothetical protein